MIQRKRHNLAKHHPQISYSIPESQVATTSSGMKASYAFHFPPRSSLAKSKTRTHFYNNAFTVTILHLCWKRRQTSGLRPFPKATLMEHCWSTSVSFEFTKYLRTPRGSLSLLPTVLDATNFPSERHGSKPPHKTNSLCAEQ